MTAASIAAERLGVRFLFDRSQRVVTPAHAALTRRPVETWGLRGVDFQIGPGEGVALIGSSGSGKTTLLRAIGGVLPADEGRIEARGRLGSLLSIDAGLLPTLTGRENALLLGVLVGLSRGESRRNLESVKSQSGLGEAFERPASSFSQGMRARLALFTAEQARPDVLLLDEVHEALDHRFRSLLAGRARQLIAQGGIVVAAGHDHEMLAHLCTRCIWLSEGGVRGDGPFDEVRAAYLDGGDGRAGGR
jgi:lipopolysaccharide transport system ATP-binding protein